MNTRVKIKIKGLAFEVDPGTVIAIEDDIMYIYEDAEERDSIESTDWEYQIDLRTAEGWERHSGTTQGCIWTDWEHMPINKFNTIVL